MKITYREDSVFKIAVYIKEISFDPVYISDYDIEEVIKESCEGESNFGNFNSYNISKKDRLNLLTMFFNCSKILDKHKTFKSIPMLAYNKYKNPFINFKREFKIDSSKEEELKNIIVPSYAFSFIFERKMFLFVFYSVDLFKDIFEK